MFFPFQCARQHSSVHLNFAQQRPQWLTNPKPSSAELGEKAMNKNGEGIF